MALRLEKAFGVGMDRLECPFNMVDNVGRETPRTSAAAATVRPWGSMISDLTNEPG